MIGRYEIKQELGRGGMAAVFLAHDPHFKRNVAIKLLPREFLHDGSFRARFTREAQTIASLEHSAIVPVYDFGEENGQPYIVMRFMSGGSLADRINHGSFPVAEVSKILVRIGAALDHAHDVGVIHRDLKPANILFDQFGNSYLADFGIARLAQATTTITGSSAIIGTPAYMSPEQVHGDVVLDGRSDIYALGIIMFEMLTGKQPYIADTPAKVMMKHILDPVPIIRETNPNVPQGCGKIISKVMAKDREQRYPTASKFAAAMLHLSAKITIVSEDDAATIVEPSPIQPKPTLEPPLAKIPALAQDRSLANRFRLQPIGLKIPILVIAALGVFMITWFGGAFVIDSIQGGGLQDEGAIALTQEAVATVEVVQFPPPTQTKVTSSVSLTSTPAYLATSRMASEITEKGKIRVGIHDNPGFWPFSIISNDRVTVGFEIELAREIVKIIFQEQVPIQWVPLTAAERFVALDSRQIDILVRRVTHTTSRDDLALWTDNYFLDGPRLLVRLGDGYRDLIGLDGKTISVPAGTTQELILGQAMADLGIAVNLLHTDTSQEAIDAVSSFEADAAFNYWSVLLALTLDDPSYAIIGDIYTGISSGVQIGNEPFAIGIPLGEEDFRDEVNEILSMLFLDGTWLEIYNRWFPNPPPWTIEEMLAAPPVER